MKRTVLRLASALFVFAAIGGGILTTQASENQDFAAEQQGTIRVSGKVVDQSGHALVGVTVVQAGNETNGAMTGLDGDFVIEVPAGSPCPYLTSVTNLLKLRLRSTTRYSTAIASRRLTI